MSNPATIKPHQSIRSGNLLQKDEVSLSTKLAAKLQGGFAFRSGSTWQREAEPTLKRLTRFLPNLPFALKPLCFRPPMPSLSLVCYGSDLPTYLLQRRRTTIVTLFAAFEELGLPLMDPWPPLGPLPSVWPITKRFNLRLQALKPRSVLLFLIQPTSQCLDPRSSYGENRLSCEVPLLSWCCLNQFEILWSQHSLVMFCDNLLWMAPIRPYLSDCRICLIRDAYTAVLSSIIYLGLFVHAWSSRGLLGSRTMAPLDSLDGYLSRCQLTTFAWRAATLSCHSEHEPIAVSILSFAPLASVSHLPPSERLFQHQLLPRFGLHSTLCHPNQLLYSFMVSFVRRLHLNIKPPVVLVWYKSYLETLFLESSREDPFEGDNSTEPDIMIPPLWSGDYRSAFSLSPPSRLISELVKLHLINLLKSLHKSLKNCGIMTSTPRSNGYLNLSKLSLPNLQTATSRPVTINLSSIHLAQPLDKALLRVDCLIPMRSLALTHLTLLRLLLKTVAIFPFSDLLMNDASILLDLTGSKLRSSFWFIALKFLLSTALIYLCNLVVVSFGNFPFMLFFKQFLLPVCCFLF